MVLKDPEPYSLVISFGDDSMNLELRYVVEFGNGLTTRDEVQTAIDREFKENGIEFALPQLKVRLPGNGDKE